MQASHNKRNGELRVVIEGVAPEIECGRFAIKRVVDQAVTVSADIFTDGHDCISARLLYKKEGEKHWRETPMTPLVNDRWEGAFTVKEAGRYAYTIEGWVDHFETWRLDLEKKFNAGQNIQSEILEGAQLIRETSTRANNAAATTLTEFSTALEENADSRDVIDIALDPALDELMSEFPDRHNATRYCRELLVTVDTRRALFSSWYEIFPRSFAREPGQHGTFKDCERLLPTIADMGFDILYFPPIHPIGTTNRKGKNNRPKASRGDVGSPWAIGSEDGGHTAIHPALGTIEDFEALVKRAHEYDIEIALDLAFQCSPDHPYVKDHPEWFKWRPDGTIHHAENPPKKYEDVIPLNFATENRRELWEELKRVTLFWVEKGVRIFRVDNPHTKPVRFWEWLITGIKEEYPDVIFLSEAFTRPKVMYRLAKLGFTQSYTYFTWRNTKQEFIHYITELTRSEVRDFFRPNFFTNTPDILPEHLQFGGRQAFIARLILAATLSSNYGMYAPAFELCIDEAVPGKEEYAHSEKYEIKDWHHDRPGHLRDVITRINTIRKDNPALHHTNNLRFCDIDNDVILAYCKATEDRSNIILVTVNLDYFHTHSGWVKLDLDDLGIDPNQPFMVHDVMMDEKYIWQGDTNYIELNPHVFPAHVFTIRKKTKRETDFDYFM